MPLTAGILGGLLVAAFGVGLLAVDRKHRRTGLVLTALGLLLAGAVAAVVVLATSSRM